MKSLQGLYINNFNLAAIKNSVKVDPSCLYSTNNTTCSLITLNTALLNVRSIMNKLEDIRNDKFIQVADILCFCETWLQPCDSSPNVKKKYEVLRVD